MKTLINVGNTGNKVYIIKDGEIQHGYDVSIIGGQYNESKKAIELQIGAGRKININTPIPTKNDIGIKFTANGVGTNLVLISGTTNKYYFLINKTYFSSNFSNQAKITYEINADESFLTTSGGVPPIQDTLRIEDSPTGKPTLIYDLYYTTE